MAKKTNPSPVEGLTDKPAQASSQVVATEGALSENGDKSGLNASGGEGDGSDRKAQASVFTGWPRVVLGGDDSANPGVPEHFGDPSGEQWALEAGDAIVERGDLAALTVAGPDRLTWLTSISSQQLKGLKAGESSELLVLNAQGHIQQAAGVLDDGEQAWLITPRARADQFAQWLDSMRFMSRVDVARADVVIFETVVPRGISAQLNGTPPDTVASVDNSSLSASSAQHPMAEDDKKDDQLDQSASKRMNSVAETAEGSRLQAAGSVAERLSLPSDLPDEQPLTWVDPWPGVSEGGVAYFGGRHPVVGHRVQLFIVFASAASEFAQSWLDADPERQPAGLLAAEALRVADWRPAVTSEVDERTLPAELDWLRTAVHTNKGCYPGQESVARTLNMGRAPRRLTFLQLDGSMGDLPSPGASLIWEDRTVGTVTSVARDADQGPIALALINRAVPADVVFDIDGVAAAQELIVPVSGRPVGAEDRSRPALKSNPALRHSDLRGAASGGLAPAMSGRATRGGSARTQTPTGKAAASGEPQASANQQSSGEQPDDAATCACGKRTSPKETRKVSVSGEDFTPDGFVTTPKSATTFGLGGGHGKHGELSVGADKPGVKVAGNLASEAAPDQPDDAATCACGKRTSPKETRKVSVSGEDFTPDGFVTTPKNATTFGLGGNKGGKHGHHGGGIGGGLRLA